MRIILKLAVIGMLLVLTVFMISFSTSAASHEIAGKGQPFGIITPDGKVYWKCDPISNNDCTIIIGDQ